jgi:hypothetical protein
VYRQSNSANEFEKTSIRQKKCAELRQLKIVNITDSEFNPSPLEKLCKLQNYNFLKLHILKILLSYLRYAND